jgi:hypothetical protein
MQNDPIWNITGLSSTDEVRLHIFFLSCVRHIVEKYGGTMETNPETYDACLDIPESCQYDCLEELENLFACGNAPDLRHQFDSYHGPVY